MSLQGEQVLLRAYLRNADRFPHAPTHELLLKAARRERLAGATVIRGIMGYGSHGLIQPTPWSLTEHAPIIVEIVDAGPRLAAFIDGPLASVVRGGMITLERANVMLYRQRSHDQPNCLSLGSLLHPLSTLPQITGSESMIVNEPGVLLRVFIGESDRFEHRPLYEAIVQKARELGLAGATVLRGSEGFGAHSIVHTSSLLDMSRDLPVVIEIVDVEDKIKLLLPSLEKMVLEGLITMEYVRILLYRQQGAAAQPTG